MKIAPFVAAVSAQLPDLGNFDLSSFDLSQFGLGPALEVPVPAAVNADDFAGPADDERYFFTNPSTTSTTTTTTTTTPSDGDTCWKCDQMTHAKCSSEGTPEKCQKGDKDCCFIEVRETAQQLQQLCTGCKSKDACTNLRDENFVGSNQITHQCRPDYRQQRVGRFNRSVQSVCRQCFNTCEAASPTGCFGESLTPSGHFQINYDFSANPTFYGWSHPLNYYQGSDFLGLGIVIGSVVDNTDAVNADITTGLVPNVYHRNAVASKAHPGGNNQNIFWGIHGATKAWWESDLKAMQNKVKSKNSNGNAVLTADVQP